MYFDGAKRERVEVMIPKTFPIFYANINSYVPKCKLLWEKKLY
jgi:hypothetical protein